MHTFDISTKKQSEMINITNQVREAVRKSGMESGFCLVFNPHTTAALTVNEQADPDVSQDILMHLNKAIPWRDGYAHAEGNSAAHIKASLFGASLVLIVERGEPVLGTWQGVFFCEFDGPRHRKVHVKPVSADLL